MYTRHVTSTLVSDFENIVPTDVPDYYGLWPRYVLEDEDFEDVRFAAPPPPPPRCPCALPCNMPPPSLSWYPKFACDL